MAADPHTPLPIRLAATSVVVRDGAEGLEVLLVQRHPSLAFYGGAWVFPGGRIDETDAANDGSENGEATARRAAVRETLEEAGLQLNPSSLLPFARWVTPPGQVRRYDTWYFAAPDPGTPVQVDGAEVIGHRWLPPTAALQAQRSGELVLPPPTFVTLVTLQPLASAQDALQALGSAPLTHYVPRLQSVSEGCVYLYEGDVAYAGGALDQPGPRHRVTALSSGWHFERSTQTRHV